MSNLSKLLTLFLTLLAYFSPVYSYAGEREFALKAGFLYNFARYSTGEWFDENVDDQYVICSLDPDFVEVAGNTLKKQIVKSRPIKTRQITAPESGCHTLFVTKAVSNNFINSTEFKNSMIVGQQSSFIADGGHISFFLAGGKIRFEVSPENLSNAGIKLSSKVLRLGRIVDGSKTP
ncbi:YfiR family protein [Vibrio hannami]|uniref:YfiR family protein n=1 Tax=Vibrio hannami TaxID=2717094 RepID=UPI0024100432|nr:YfiR family protein [Vibrio hannami]MDG3084912.1 YfiR family protein [Vibrio hannami]